MRFSHRLGMTLAATVLGLTLAATGAVADPTTPPVADPTGTEQARPADELAVTAAFDKPSYATGEAMTITVTVTNTGTAPVTTQLSLTGEDPAAVQVSATTPIEQNQDFTVTAGASVAITVTGTMGNPDVTSATLSGVLTDVAGATTPFTFAVPVRQTVGPASGVVFYDKNRNHAFDDGEGQRDVRLTWTNQSHPETVREVTTDANGEFRLDDLPTGAYDVYGEGHGGLQVGTQRVVVTESGVDGLRLRAVAPLHGLDAKVEFTKDTYAPDESPVVRVTLANTGDLAINGLVATCLGGGDPATLTGTADGWGDLVRDGVDLAPHSTTVFEVTEPMPPGSPNLGVVMVSCEFHYPDVQSTHNPYSFDRAAVPGMRGDIIGAITREDGTGLPGVRLLLVPDENFMPHAPCAVTAEATTGPDGTFEFRQVPVGIYVVYTYTPPGWRVDASTFSRADVYGDHVSELFLVATPGQAVPQVLPHCLEANTAPVPPTPQPTATTTPRPQSSTTTPLAYTGVDILAPGITGLLAVLAGTGMVLLSRRRRPAGD